jgi:putative restriction endonuclease
VTQLLQSRSLSADAQLLREAAAGDENRFGREYMARARLGQGIFRLLVTDAYHRRCAVTGEKVLPALEAAHIKSHASSGPNRVDNGLLLRSDIHRLFDKGYVTVTTDLRVDVSSSIREEFNNGIEYYRLRGQRLVQLPESVQERPRREYLEWHQENVFRAG